MGSVKHLIIGENFGERFAIDNIVLREALRLFRSPESNSFGMGGWWVTGAYSIGDLKWLITQSEIKDKAQALTMVFAAYIEHLANTHPDIKTCYEGLIGPNGKKTDLQGLLQRGETSNVVVMKLAHTPESFLGKEKVNNEDLLRYRRALQSGALRCGVADVESIFRLGFPLGSSTFEKIFKAFGKDLGKGHEEEYTRWYEDLAKYDETVEALDEIRATVKAAGIEEFPELRKVLKRYGLGETIPNPGFVLKEPVYGNTTKFESGGDRGVSDEEARNLMGLSDEGYNLWVNDMMPRSSKAQIKFCQERGILNIDGKEELVAYNGMPVITDFACSPDENRLMIEIKRPDGIWAIPSNKEIQRGVGRSMGVYSAIGEAKRKAERDGRSDEWRAYFPKVCEEKRLDMKEFSDRSCELMSHAIGEVANRILGRRVFDAKPLESWVESFMPYASKVERQK